MHENAGISMRGVRAIDHRSLDRWRAELPRVKGELLRHPQMADWLIRLGYEPDRAWADDLEGVAPYFGDYKNERPHLLRRFEASLRFGLKTVRYLCRRRLRAAPGS